MSTPLPPSTLLIHCHSLSNTSLLLLHVGANIHKIYCVHWLYSYVHVFGGHHFRLCNLSGILTLRKLILPVSAAFDA